MIFHILLHLFFTQLHVFLLFTVLIAFFSCTHLYSGSFLLVDVHLIVLLETDVCLLSLKRAVISRSLCTIVGAFDIPDPQ